MYLHNELTQDIIGAAIEVHRTLGPGLLESAYEHALCHELSLRSVAFQRQVDVPVHYKGIALGSSYRMDLLVNEAVVVEVKAVEQPLPIHASQLLTYLRLSGGWGSLTEQRNYGNIREFVEGLLRQRCR